MKKVQNYRFSKSTRDELPTDWSKNAILYNYGPSDLI